MAKKRSLITVCPLFLLGLRSPLTSNKKLSHYKYYHSSTCSSASFFCASSFESTDSPSSSPATGSSTPSASDSGFSSEGSLTGSPSPEKNRPMNTQCAYSIFLSQDDDICLYISKSHKDHSNDQSTETNQGKTTISEKRQQQTS